MRRGCLCLAGLISVIILLLTGADRASASVYSVNSAVDGLHFEKVRGYDRVTMTDARSLGKPGNPLLPAKFVQVSTPTEQEVIAVEIISFKYEELPGAYNIYPAQPYVPISRLPARNEQIDFVLPNPAIYDLWSEYPGELAQVTNNGFLGGHHIAGVALYPLQYIPAQGKLILYTEIEFKLILRPTTRFPASVNRRSEKTAEFYSDIVKDVVINPEALQSLAKGSFGKGDGEVDFLIVTADSLVPVFEELADWKIRKGISTKIESLSVIDTCTSYAGDDTQEKIRNCVRHYYQDHGTKWVLIGGDTDIIPHRLAWARGESEALVPCDLYYSDLDGTWDDNGNAVYGEYPDAIDMYPDVFVGRAPSQDSSEAGTFVDKCLTYETDPPSNHQSKILYAAGIPHPAVDGAEIKQYIDSTIVPDDYDTTKLYKRWNNLDRSTFGSGLSEGQHIVNHFDHGWYTNIRVGDEHWYGYDMDTLTNGPRHFLFYSLSCHSAAIDQECFAESTMNNPDGGAFAYCGNSHFGWGCGDLDGPALECDLQFFEAWLTDDIYQLGKTFGYSKIPIIPISQDPDSLHPVVDDTDTTFWPGCYWRWAMFALTLLGDPTLDLWGDEPDSLAVSHKSTFYSGEVYLQVDVNQDDALVTCVKDGELIGSAYSNDGTAVVYFDSSPDTGTMHVTATKRNWIPDHQTVAVRDTTLMGLHLIYYSHTAIDSGTNSNGGINPGDTVYMKVTLKKLGTLTPLAVDGTLRTTDTLVSMIDSTGEWGGFEGKGGTMVQTDYFVFACTSSCPDSHLVEFEIEWKVGASTWKDSIFQLVLDPDFTVETSVDTAFVRKGDSTDVVVTVTSVAGYNSTVTLYTWGLPSGVTSTWHPDPIVTPTESCTLRLHADSTATEGAKICSLYALGIGLYHIEQLGVRVLPEPHQGNVWYVSVSGNDEYCDGSEGCPFRTIQKAIDAAANSDTVLVKPGAYVETIDFKGKAILLTSQVMNDSLWWTVDSTIINADDSGSVVTFDSSETNSSVLRGFTLIHGAADKGAGIYCYNASPTIAMNKLVANACTTNGSAIYYYNSDTSMASIKIEKNVIHHCSGTGAVYLEGGNDAQLANNTVANNDSNGLYIDGGCDATVKNSIFWGNDGCEIVLDSGSCTISFSDVDTSNDEGYCGMDDQTGSNGNIYADPDFRDTLLATEDYRFADSTSSCIDAGDSTDTDVPWWGRDRIDMGAMEFPLEYDIGDVQSDWAIDDGDISYLTAYLYSGGPPCYPPPAGDCTCDGLVTLTDLTYLINYLHKGGPDPPDNCDEKSSMFAADGFGPYQDVAPAKLALSEGTVSEKGVFEIAVMAKSGVDLVAIDLQIAFNPEEVTLTIPALTQRTEGLQLYSSINHAVQKIGILDIEGRHFISRGTGSVVILRGLGQDLSSLKIVTAVLVDRDARVIPVEIVSGIEEEKLAKTEEANLPKTFSLSQNQPNPFNPETKISFALPRDCHVTLTIYNVIGRKVKTVMDEPKAAGWHEAIWYGKDEKGNDLASGVYFYRLEADEFSQSKKMLLLK